MKRTSSHPLPLLLQIYSRHLNTLRTLLGVELLGNQSLACHAATQDGGPSHADAQASAASAAPTAHRIQIKAVLGVGNGGGGG